MPATTCAATWSDPVRAEPEAEAPTIEERRSRLQPVASAARGLLAEPRPSGREPAEPAAKATAQRLRSARVSREEQRLHPAAFLRSSRCRGRQLEQLVEPLATERHAPVVPAPRPGARRRSSPRSGRRPQTSPRSSRDRAGARLRRCRGDSRRRASPSEPRHARRRPHIYRDRRAACTTVAWSVSRVRACRERLAVCDCTDGTPDQPLDLDRPSFLAACDASC
jgi:hypothetical protein